MKAAGHKGSDLKVMIGKGEIEFLRNNYLDDGCIYGFLNRSIPNLISSDL